MGYITNTDSRGSRHDPGELFAHHSNSVCRRSPPDNPCDYDQTFAEIKVVEDSVVPNAPTPASRLPFETLDVALERVLFHRLERRLNAFLISW